MTDFAALVRRIMAERGMSLRGLAAEAHYDPGLLSKVLNGHRPCTPYLAAQLDRALSAGGQIETAGQEPPPRRPLRPRSRGNAPRAVEAIQAVAAGDPDGAEIVSESLAELAAHYAQVLPVAPTVAVYEELRAVRSYAGTLISKEGARKRTELTTTAGWMSALLAVAATDLGDHAAAVVWCSDAERRGQDAHCSELLGWPALTRAVIAYYQGNAAASAELAARGQELAPAGSAARARLAAQEMRSRAMLGDTAETAAARQRAELAMEQLTPGTPATGIWGIPRDTDPPYTATSLLISGRYREAIAVSRRIIKGIYHSHAQPPGEQPTRNARTLLILGLAAAGAGDADEAAATGSTALECGWIVWPTMVLASRLDRYLTKRAAGTAYVADYHARVTQARERLALTAPSPDTRTGAG